jgi:hypothetical protein
MNAIIFIPFILISSALACPDFTGTYRRDNSLGCEMSKLKNMRATPVIPFSIRDNQDVYISDGDFFTIDQKSCVELNFSYINNDSTWSDFGQMRTTTVEIGGGKVKASENNLTVTGNSKGETCTMFGCIKTRDKTVLSLTKEDDKLVRIYAMNKYYGSINIIIPVYFRGEVDCLVEKID